jgi:uncharacterized protein
MFVIKTRVGPSQIHGTGVFACENVAIGGPVWRFHPPFDQILSEQDIADLPQAAREYLQIYAYTSSDLGGQLVLSGDHARFLNHSDDPNTEARPFLSIARRSIASGDEITCDYGAFCVGWTGLDDAAFSPSCRHVAVSTMSSAYPHCNLYTRLKACAHGVGVFAIRDIPAGMRLFKGDSGMIVRVPRSAVDRIADPELRRMYFDFCPSVDDVFIAPADFNLLTMEWYLNHSANPNVAADHNMQFSSCRPIAAGEELTTDYASFSDHSPALVSQWNCAGNRK